MRLSAITTAQSSGLIGQVGAVGNTCTFSYALVVTLTLDFDEDTRNTVTTGHFDTSWTETEVSRSCPNTQPGGGTFGPQTDDIDGQPTSNLRYRRVDTGSPPAGGTLTIITAFSGAVSGDTVTGTFSIEKSYVFPQRGITETQPMASGPVVLQKRGP